MQTTFCSPTEWEVISINFQIPASWSELSDLSRSALLAKNHGSDAVDDYMEFNDDLRDFEEAYCGESDSDREAATTEWE